jgi:hypothetical protein
MADPKKTTTPAKSTGSIFGDLDIASAEDNPFAIPDGVYEVFVTECVVGLTKKEDKLGMTLTYTIDGGPKDKSKISEFKHVPRPSDDLTSDQRERAKSFLKQRLASLGVPEDKMNSLYPADLIGTAAAITVVTNKEGYTNVTKVVPRKADVFNR